VDWINLAHDLDKWRAFVYGVMEISVPQNEEVSLTSWGTETLQSLCPIELVKVSLNLKLQAAAPNCWDLEGSDRVPVSGHTEQLWRETDRQTDRHTHTHTHKISVMLSHATSGLSQHWPCQTLLRPTGWKILKGSWNFCGSELSRQNYSSHKPRADNISFKCLTCKRCQLLSSYSVDNKRMNEYRALVEWYWQETAAVITGKPVPVPLCTPQIPQWLSRGLNPGLLKVSPATKRLSHGAASETYVVVGAAEENIVTFGSLKCNEMLTVCFSETNG